MANTIHHHHYHFQYLVYLCALNRYLLLVDPDYSYEEAISKGASDFLFKPVRFAELLLRLKRVLKERALVSERKVMEEQLRKLTVTDALTKLFNSRYFFPANINPFQYSPTATFVLYL